MCEECLQIALSTLAAHCTLIPKRVRRPKARDNEIGTKRARADVDTDGLRGLRDHVSALYNNMGIYTLYIYIYRE